MERKDNYLAMNCGIFGRLPGVRGKRRTIGFMIVDVNMGTIGFVTVRGKRQTHLQAAIYPPPHNHMIHLKTK